VITTDELEQYFGKLCDKTIIKKLMTEADIDKDGVISYEDFMEMMKRFMVIYTENLKMIS
jgi:Ca2+-binding EF-hand superfamily protein